jgi:hypothetical protein
MNYFYPYKLIIKIQNIFANIIKLFKNYGKFSVAFRRNEEI